MHNKSVVPELASHSSASRLICRSAGISTTSPQSRVQQGWSWTFGRRSTSPTAIWTVWRPCWRRWGVTRTSWWPSTDPRPSQESQRITVSALPTEEDVPVPISFLGNATSAVQILDLRLDVTWLVTVRSLKTLGGTFLSICVEKCLYLYSVPRFFSRVLRLVVFCATQWTEPVTTRL